ncbi:MAG TPA: hypothetical protein ACFYEF_03120 [Candidatus Wunengus sp. YC63]|uniref:hypothetical protein n=1 Tax=Candidatus Wunengus sp. YC63 TaxID=3367699 RepID=UPI004027D7AB
MKPTTTQKCITRQNRNQIPTIKGGTIGIRVKLRNSWDGMDCRDALTVHLYSPCLLVIHKSMKVTGDVASHCPPLAGD